MTVIFGKQYITDSNSSNRVLIRVGELPKERTGIDTDVIKYHVANG